MVRARVSDIPDPDEILFDDAIAPSGRAHRKPFRLWGQSGKHEFELFEESTYYKAIRRILGDDVSPDWWLVQYAEASLQFVPNEGSGADTIQVLIGGKLVGRFYEVGARNYSGVLSYLVEQGWIPRVSAEVGGKFELDPDYDSIGNEIERKRFFGNVRLDLGKRHLLVPANEPPPNRHVVLPQGYPVRFATTAELGPLIPLSGGEGEAWVYATLHEALVQDAHAFRDTVEVKVNGLAVGLLAPDNAAVLLPAIRHFAKRGVASAGRALVEADERGVSFDLHVGRSDSLSREFFDTVPMQRQPQDVACSVRFNPPPGWPLPLPGWRPRPWWTPPEQLPPAPKDWQWQLPA
jgi:hypothetical protein